MANPTSNNSGPTTTAPAATTIASATPGATTAYASVAAGVTATATATPAANGTQPSGPVSLYVGELSPEVTESMLYELFSQLGQVASIRVCRDAITRRSLGYAYVNYHTYAEAERALEALNYTVIKGQPCRIMWSQRDPSLRKSGSGNIFIKNLDKTIDTKALHDVFANFGNILSCKVVSDSNGSKGFGFVHFETQESAELAIEKVNGMLLNDKKVFVGPHVSRRERQSKSEELRNNFTNIYIKNLDLSMGDEDLQKMFIAFGEITSAVVQRDENGASRGFGFLNFENADSARAAVDAMNETEINGQKLYVGRAQKKSERESELRRAFEQQRLERMNKYQGINLYVKNLEEFVDDERLRSEFAVYGSITSAKVMRDERGVSRGFGFVCFSTADEASKAVTEMNGRMIGTKPIYVALAQRKEIRRHQLEATHAQRNQIRMQQAAAAAMYAGAQASPAMYYGGSGGAVHPMQRGGPPTAAYLPGGYAAGQPMVPGAGPMMQPRPRWANAAGAGGAVVSGPGGRVAGAYGTQGSNNNRGPMNRQYNNNNSSNGPRGKGSAGRPGPNAGSNNNASNTTNNNNSANGNPNAANNNASKGQQPNAATNATNVAGELSNAMGNLTLESLSNASPEKQKQMLGERLYRLIEPMDARAGKITGMLLEMDNSELLHLLEDSAALELKVKEAVEALEEQ